MLGLLSRAMSVKRGNDLRDIGKFWYNPVMEKKKSKLTAVSETNLGVYVWQLPDETFVADENANVMSITAMRGDLSAISKITAAAKHYGFEEGTAVFLEGARKITDDELQEQVYRMNQGLVPDPYDIGVYKEEMRRKR